MKKALLLLLIGITSIQARSFDFSQKHIQKFVSGASGSRVLDLSHRNIKSLPDDVSSELKPVIEKHSVEKIDLSKNKLKKVEKGVFNNINKVTYIVLSHNRIKTVEPGAFKSLPALQWIDFSYNAIKNLQIGTFDDLTGLWGLILSHNAIVSFGPAVLEELRLLYHLDLSHNKITKLTTAMFTASDAERYITVDKHREPRISNLEVINLSGNTIKTVEPDVFAGLPNLKQVIVSDNLSHEVMKSLKKSIEMVRHAYQKSKYSDKQCQLVLVPSASKS